MNTDLPFIAHLRESDGKIQTLEEHLRETGSLCGGFASMFGMPLNGKLLGLIHDLGKYSEPFQQYIREGTGQYGDEGRLLAAAKRGKIDHATAGALHVWRCLGNASKTGWLLAQILSVTIMSHHSRSGIKDFVSLEGKSAFLKRLSRLEKDSHYEESLEKCDPEVVEEIDSLLNSLELLEEFKAVASAIKAKSQGKIANRFSFGMLTRLLFSCLLDADRLSTANFEDPKSAKFRSPAGIPDWEKLTAAFEEHLSIFAHDSEVNRIRHTISEECRVSATRQGHLFTLSVPTGGGKTLASLRFALHRAMQRTTGPVERIIYVLPYTSIIEQNAEVARDILGDAHVLEHHSNIIPERDTWPMRTLSENWDAPVVFTTSVQFLDSLFAAGTRTSRRMHQLTNSIVIFDEVQALPIKTIHIFNNAVRFLSVHMNSTVLLCTATMPLLHRVDAGLGALPLTPECEVISDKTALFEKLKRTEILDLTRDTKWTHPQVASLALENVSRYNSTLVVCNTKDSARRLFDLLCSDPNAPKIIHLSTSMCPAHRRAFINRLRDMLARGESVVCVSTQLIEAGVDLDFGCVIRSLAGMDSVVQAGGRCNRNGNREIGYVYILNFAEEPLAAALADIVQAQKDTLRLLGDFQDSPASLGESLLSEQSMERFYAYHYFERAKEMLYPLSAGTGTPPLAADTSVLALLTENPGGVEAARREENTDALALPLHHAFSTAAQAFRVIDAPTQGIMVPFEEGRKIIADLCSAIGNPKYPLAEQVRLLKLAQQYTVNVFPHMIAKLDEDRAIQEVQPGSEIYFLDERHYHNDYGISLTATSELHFLESA